MSVHMKKAAKILPRQTIRPKQFKPSPPSQVIRAHGEKLKEWYEGRLNEGQVKTEEPALGAVTHIEGALRSRK